MSDYTVFDLFRLESQRKNFLILCYIWFVSSLIFYFLSLNIKNFTGNIYINGVIICCAEICVVFLVGLLANQPSIGRKGTLWILCLIGLITQFICIFISNKSVLFTSLMMINRTSVSGSFSVVYFVSNEIYPTVLRAKGLGFNSVIARIGGIIAPFILDLIAVEYNLMFFCLLNILTIILISFLEETNNKALKELPDEDCYKASVVELLK